ncbi:MAG: hypothetical protein J6Y27_05005, partial [Bacteroidales bacterium]|nr:hypothetical protein [Bacteroidales bacterium]
MKTIEDIEKMSAEELEQLFEDRSQDAPEGLEARLGAAVTAAAAREAWGGEAPLRWIWPEEAGRRRGRKA